MGGGKVKRYKFCGITIFEKERTTLQKSWRFFNIRIVKDINTVNSHLNYKKYIQTLFSTYLDKTCFEPKTISQPPRGTFPKLIAFYLPQYHLFPENEKWHGLGFTDWSNVAKALPHFIGHRQPQLPIDVGFYDLAHTDVMKRQVELAKLYGIYGFCFHYYWFSGKRLMEKPIFNWLHDKSIDFPFCLCWANENWSKLWDGGNQEILIKQELHENDDVKFAKDIIPFFKDKRYIKMNNKPLFIVYHPALFKQKRFCKFVDILKKECQNAGVEDLFILITNRMGFQDDPCQWNADGLVEFPPHGIDGDEVSRIKKKFILNNSRITVYDFAKYIQEKKYLFETPYNLFKGVFPSWDNTARKAFTRGICFYGETPKLYQQWLTDCLKWTQKHHPTEEQFVFINAWNEWAEGAHLEPDTYYGYAYLQATKKALNDVSRR